MPHDTPCVTGLFAYPVKSCAGIELETAQLDEFGIRGDRRWMIVDPSGRFITQRDVPRMARIRTTLAGDRVTLHAPEDRPSNATWAAPAPLVLTPPEGVAPITVTVWRDHVSALPAGDDEAEWFSGVLGVPCRPVFMPDASFRPSQYPGRARVGFADAFPFLLVSRESVEHLSEKAGVPLSVRRFRPNIVVSGVAPHAEDGWTRIRIGDVPFAVVKACSRCVVTTIDPDTGEPSKEPLRTLATYRKKNGKVMFGMNAVHETRGTIRVGDAVSGER